MDEQIGRRRGFAGECVTLAGLALAVVSGSLPWTLAPPAMRQSPLPGAMFVSTAPLPITGFMLRLGSVRAGWIVVLAAAVCAAALVLPPERIDRPRLRQTQTALGAIVLGVALLHIAMQPGVIIAIACGAALIAGAAMRYG